MMSRKQKLELTWIGKDNPEYDVANIEPRILQKSTCQALLRGQVEGRKGHGVRERENR